MEKKINDIITKYQELRNSAWNDYRNICSQEQKEISDIIDFKGKYLKILEDGEYIYIYVLNQYLTNDQERGNDFFIHLIGPGVTFCIDEYFECTHGNFDEEFKYELNVSKIKLDLRNIEEISRKEFITECEDHFTTTTKSFIKLL